MKCKMRNAVRLRLLTGILSLAALLPATASPAAAQGVTPGSMAGVVVDANMAPVRDAQVIAIHLPSGTTYEATTRPDGRFFIPGMRVGGPYSVTVAYSGRAAPPSRRRPRKTSTSTWASPLTSRSP